MKFLQESCLHYVDHLLYVRPQYGWGWTREDIDDDPDTPAWTQQERAGPPDFQVRVQRFYTWRQELRGAIGVIEQPGHVYHNMWLAFYVRTAGQHDFTTRLGTYNLLLGPEEPVLGDPAEDPAWAWYWPILHFTGSPQVVGYGKIAASHQTLQDFDWSKFYASESTG